MITTAIYGDRNNMSIYERLYTDGKKIMLDITQRDELKCTSVNEPEELVLHH